MASAIALRLLLPESSSAVGPMAVQTRMAAGASRPVNAARISSIVSGNRSLSKTSMSSAPRFLAMAIANASE